MRIASEYKQIVFFFFFEANDLSEFKNLRNYICFLKIQYFFFYNHRGLIKAGSECGQGS